jgi:hypothetical protein
VSRGLGTLQRDILRTLETAKLASIPYRGCAHEEKRQGWPHDRPWPWDQPGWVWVRGARVQLAEGIYDLRASAAFLAQKAGQTSATDYGGLGYYVHAAFTATFSRAVSGLLRRGALEMLGHVPIAAWHAVPGKDLAGLVVERRGRVIVEAAIEAHPRQARFVRKR